MGRTLVDFEVIPVTTSSEFGSGRETGRHEPVD